MLSWPHATRRSARAFSRTSWPAIAVLIPASIFYPVSARIAETIGYEMGLWAAKVASFAVLGAPDVVVMTFSDFAEQARPHGRASSLPLLVDAITVRERAQRDADGRRARNGGRRAVMIEYLDSGRVRTQDVS